MEVIIPGEPKGKGRPRATVIHGHARVYTPSATASYENLVRLCFLEQNADAKPSKGPIVVKMEFRFAYPKSAYWPVNKNHRGEIREEWKRKQHTSKPDADNLIKAVLDGLNGVAFDDDSQVVSLIARKTYGETAEAQIEIKEWDE